MSQRAREIWTFGCAADVPRFDVGGGGASRPGGLHPRLWLGVQRAHHSRLEGLCVWEPCGVGWALGVVVGGVGGEQVGKYRWATIDTGRRAVGEVASILGCKGRRTNGDSDG